MFFQSFRNNSALASRARTMASPIPVLGNATFHATVFDAVDHTKGGFPRGDLKTVHLDLLRAEIYHCGSEVDPKINNVK